MHRFIFPIISLAGFVPPKPSPRFSPLKKKKKSDFFSFHFLLVPIFTPPPKIEGTSDWHCTTTLAVPRIMRICVKGKAHTKIRSKVRALKASNSGQKSCSSTDRAVPYQLLRCHATSNNDIF